MRRKTGIFFCLLAFTFQAVFFNVFLYGFFLSVKVGESKCSQGLQCLSLTKNQYKRLQWMGADEFSFGRYLIDVKEEKNLGDRILIFYKVDLKEKDFLEKLTEHANNSKNKKGAGFAFPCKISEPGTINFISQSTTLKHKNTCVSILETQGDRSSPPPKA